MTPKKHAYMITAHKNDLTFYTLLSMLDHPRNDLYIHMDINNRAFDPESVKQYVQHSQVYFVPRIHVVWADYTLTYVKILELQTAIETGNDYAYYHFISGEDLPIQTQEDIHAFFDAHQGKEFVNYEWQEFPYQNRIRYYYFFQDKAGRGRSLYKWFFRGLDRISVGFQKLFGVWRNPDVPFQKGEGWASITRTCEACHTLKGKENSRVTPLPVYKVLLVEFSRLNVVSLGCARVRGGDWRAARGFEGFARFVRPCPPYHARRVLSQLSMYEE